MTAKHSVAGAATMTSTEHRRAAEDALVEAQLNPVMSVEQSFRAAEVHALLAIEQQLGDILTKLREPAPRSRAPRRST